MSKESDRSERKKILLYVSGVGMGAGSELIALVFFGLWLGKVVDSKWNVAPFGTLASVLLFLGSGLAHIVLILLKMQKKIKNLKEDGDKPK